MINNSISQCCMNSIQIIVLAHKYRATNSITDMARSGRPRVTTERTDHHIAILSKSDRFKPETAIRDELEVVCEVNVSVSIVKRVLDKVGL